MRPDVPSAPAVDPAATLLLVVGRNNWKRGSRGLSRVVDELGRAGMPVLRYESRTGDTRRWLDERVEPWLAALPAGWAALPAVRWLLKLGLLAGRPSRWDYLFARRHEVHHTGVAALRRFIARQHGRRVVLLTHSAGGIAGAMAEDAPPLLCHVCFGYPFQHPERPPEPRRTEVLARVARPLLIVQGERDEYGSAAEARRRWPLSPAITLLAVDDDHQYDALGEVEIQALLHTIKAFIGLAPAGAAAHPPENPD